MAAADSGEPSEARMPLPPSPSPPPPPPPATPHPIASARKRRATHTDAYLESVYTPAQRPKGREGGIIVTSNVPLGRHPRGAGDEAISAEAAINLRRRPGGLILGKGM